jgi:hypothetical protein
MRFCKFCSKLGKSSMAYTDTIARAYWLSWLSFLTTPVHCFRPRLKARHRKVNLLEFEDRARTCSKSLMMLMEALLTSTIKGLVGLVQAHSSRESLQTLASLLSREDRRGGLTTAERTKKRSRESNRGKLSCRSNRGSKKSGDG